MAAVILPELCRVFPEYTEQLEESTKPAVSADALQTAAGCILPLQETDAVSCVSHARTVSGYCTFNLNTSEPSRTVFPFLTSALGRKNTFEVVLKC